MNLRETQQQFIKHVFHQHPNGLSTSICTDSSLSGTQRLQIYHQNIYVGLSKALTSLYPATQKIVGEDFFNAAAYHYIQQHPSTVVNLNQFGKDFSAFIAEFAPAQSLPYLPELAQLEWGYHQTSLAPDAEPLALTQLATIPQARYDQIKFHLHPASQLFSFSYPIFRIWQLCQAAQDSAENIDLGAGGEFVLLIRRQLTIEFELLSAAEFALLSAFVAGKKFADACATTLKLDANFGVANALQQHILRGLIVGFS